MKINSLLTRLTGALLFCFMGSCMAIDTFTPASIAATSEPTQLAAISSANTETQKLYILLNAYRAEKNLPPIPYSPKLAKTAQAHAQDLSLHSPHEASAPDGADCNLHSWSNQGSWTPVCYTSDHREAKKMWSKPAEVAGYASSGYEISAYSTGCHTAECWLAQWKASPGHNQVMVNEGIWADSTWKAVGIGIDGDFANIWFGEVTDN
jgi:hypothetical protein